MNKCQRCNVWIADDTQVCPFCNTVLRKDDETETGYSSYPDITSKTRILVKLSRIGLFVVLVMQFIFILVNVNTYHRYPVRWSVITGVSILYLMLTIRDLMARRGGHIKKIYFQVLGLLALLFCIDFTLGYKGWSLYIGVPILIIAIDGLVLVCMIVDFDNWQNYLLMQIFTAVLATIDFILMVLGVPHIPVLSWVSFGVSLALPAGTILIGDRKATNELKRKFHV